MTIIAVGFSVTTPMLPSEATHEGRRSLPSTLAAFLPAIVVAGLWTAWTADDGAYFASSWYPSAIGLVALLGVVVLAGGRGVTPSRPARAALALLAGFVIWSYLSILWAGSPGGALEESNKLLLLLVSVSFVAVLPWSERSATVLLGAWVLGVAGVMAVDLIGALDAGEQVRQRLVAGRYLGPIGYPNGTSAVCAMALFAALLIASRRGTRPAIQIGFVAVATFLLEYALLPQSRAAVVGLAVGGVIALALAPDRIRFMLRVLIVAGAAVVTLDPLLDIYSIGVEIYYEQATDAQLAPVFKDAGREIMLTVGAAAVAASFLLAAEAALAPRSSAVRRLRMGAVGLAVVVALAGAAVAVANADRIYDRVHDGVSGDDSDSFDTGPRITASFTDKRSDYWRVAVDVFEEHPVAGVGTGSYGEEYTTRRNQDQTYNKYPHDLALRALAENGVIGALLLFGSLGVLIGGLALAWRGAPAGARTLLAAGAAVLGYFLVHASFDWVEMFPALVVPALSLPFVGLAVVGGSSRARRTTGPLVLVAGVAIVAVASLSLSLPYLSNRYVERATSDWRADPGGALQDLDRAASLNPLSARPLVRKGTIAVRLGRLGLAREAFRDALERQDEWYPHFQLGLIEASGENFPAARSELRLALALNPRDIFVLEARDRVAKNRRVDPAGVNAKIAAANRQRFTTPGN